MEKSIDNTSFSNNSTLFKIIDESLKAKKIKCTALNAEFLKMRAYSRSLTQHIDRQRKFKAMNQKLEEIARLINSSSEEARKIDTRF